MSAEYLPAIVDHYRAELEATNRSLVRQPDDVLQEHARQLDIAIRDWEAITKRTASEMAFVRRRRHAWMLHNASFGDMTELGQKSHALASNELAALDAVDPRPPPGRRG